MDCYNIRMSVPVGAVESVLSAIGVRVLFHGCGDVHCEWLRSGWKAHYSSGHGQDGEQVQTMRVDDQVRPPSHSDVQGRSLVYQNLGELAQKSFGSFQIVSLRVSLGTVYALDTNTLDCKTVAVSGILWQGSEKECCTECNSYLPAYRQYNTVSLP